MSKKTIYSRWQFRHGTLLIPVLLMLQSHALLAQSSKPLKIGMELDGHSVELGKNFNVKCVLLDADNKPAKAPKNFVVDVQSISASGKTSTIPVTVKEGESSYRLTIQATEAGITELKAKQKELQDGNTFIKVKSPKVIRELLLTNALTAPAPATASSTHSLMAALPRAAMVMAVSTPSPPPTPSNVSLSHPASPSFTDAGLILKHESRKFMADGKDAATITAFLSDGMADVPTDIQVILHDSLGIMLPLPLVIPKGQDFGESKITSDHVGAAAIEFITSNPKMNILSEKVILVNFGPPIVGLAIQVSPSKISLLENADVSIQLLSSSGTPIATDEPRQVDLSFTGGGQLQSSSVTIPANTSTVHTKFYPIHLGAFKINAASDNLLIQSVDISVLPPTALLAASSLGGLLGGLLAASVSQKRRKDKSGRVVRVLLGIGTGFAFYYFAVLGFNAQIPGQVALNPFGAIFLSMVGGWLGTEVFTPICKILIPKAK